ncbi:hypothetical protein QR680_008423 [Steinernema hermaphroditum]|uniref:Uncharacterized protein n=1 Tax=Steinernema hermaphroditum TaxID=289476 RepID=A0AA39M7U4_9BILA|nr:hypothetical protein QR680_008423 [Steinernema hermaphroditum]
MGCQVSKAKRAKKGQKSALVVTDTNVVKDSENVKSTEASSRSASGSGSSKKVSKSSKKASRTEEIIESISKRTEKEPEDLQPPRKEESILDDSVFMNPNVGVETAKLVRARSPERDVERTQSDERERSPPPPQPPNVIVNEIMQQGKDFIVWLLLN